MIIDTDVLIDVMQADEKAVQKISDIEEQDVRLRLSSVSLFELYHSVMRVNSPTERRRRIETVVESRPVYPADETVMKKAGRIDGRLTSLGSAIGMGDTIIGATALINDETILTRNVRHFERIDDLDIATY